MERNVGDMQRVVYLLSINASNETFSSTSYLFLITCTTFLILMRSQLILFQLHVLTIYVFEPKVHTFFCWLDISCH